MDLVKIPFDRESIKLEKIFENDDLKNYKIDSLVSGKIKYVYGDLKFPEISEDRPLTLASFVTSIDGKIAFNDAPEGPFIAQKNKLDAYGASADFWVLNLLRATCDGIIVGAGTMKMEPDMTAHVFDQDLEDARAEANKSKVPFNIIASLDGSDIPFDHKLFSTPEVPIMLFTSPVGLYAIEKNCARPHFVVGPFSSIEQIDNDAIIKLFDKNKSKIPVIITGQGNETNPYALLKVLRVIGIKKLLIESPSYAHHLIENQLLDEMFLNYSCLYIGGTALGLGDKGEAFTSVNHPHTRMLSIHSHSPHFFYFRHKMIY